MILKLSALGVVAFAQRSEKSEKSTVTLWIKSTKNFLSHRVSRWLSLYPSLPRMIQMYSALQLQSYFMFIDKPTVVLSQHYLRP